MKKEWKPFEDTGREAFLAATNLEKLREEYPNSKYLEENRKLDAQVVRLDAIISGAGRFRRTRTTDIMATSFPAIKWVVPGYLSEGFLVLAGRQKLGKTWLAIDMALAVAVGGVAIGSIPCEQGDVLYIDMENGPRRVQSRISTLYPDEQNRPDLSRLEWVTEAPQLDAGFIECLEDWRTSVSGPRLVIIDVLQRIKPPGSKTRNAYENDYSTWAPLQHWATKHGIAVLGLHHTKKGGADDPLEALSGSNGLSAVADTTLVLDSDQNGKTLYVRGRDVEEKETALLFNGGAWSILGEAADVRRSGERGKIIAALDDHGSPMTPLEITSATGMPRTNVRQLLYKMAKAGEVHKVGAGRYWLEPVAPNHSDNTDNRDLDGPAESEDFEEEAVTGETVTDNSFDPRIYGGPEGEVSRRRKCSHCHKQGGEVVKVWHGLVQPWLHHQCIKPWKADYAERFPEGPRD